MKIFTGLTEQWKNLTTHDRRSRKSYWKIFATITILSIIFFNFQSVINPWNFGIRYDSVVGIVFIAILAAFSVGRCHDRNKSGGWALLLFIPLVSLWILVELLALRGSVGQNKYGPDPLEPARTKKQRTECSEQDIASFELDRKMYDEIASSQSLLLDRSIITISGASFTIAMGFIDKTIPLASAIHVNMLWFSLVVLALTIVTTVFSFHLSVAAATEARSKLDVAQKENHYELIQTPNKYTIFVNITNQIRLYSFFIGILLLAAFIFINGLHNASTNGNKSLVRSKTYPEAAEPSCPTAGKERIQSSKSSAKACPISGQITQKLIPAHE